VYKQHPCPYYYNASMCGPGIMNNACNMCPYSINTPMQNTSYWNPLANQPMPFTVYAEDDASIKLKDYGPKPFVVNIEEVTKQNDNYRTALWTGNNMQLTLMSIEVGGDIGLEVHPQLDQFIRIEEGQGLVKMGDQRENLNFQEKVYDDFAFIIPAGKWHNLINTGNKPLKLYSIYAPTQHPHGTIHQTKAIAQAAEEDHEH